MENCELNKAAGQLFRSQVVWGIRCRELNGRHDEKMDLQVYRQKFRCMLKDKKDGGLPADISATILSVAKQRGSEKSTCPSEIARMLFPDDWREHMKDVVEVAIDLHHKNMVAITQKGIPIDVAHIKGPIRIKIV